MIAFTSSLDTFVITFLQPGVQLFCIYRTFDFSENACCCNNLATDLKRFGPNPSFLNLICLIPECCLTGTEHYRQSVYQIPPSCELHILHCDGGISQDQDRCCCRTVSKCHVNHGILSVLGLGDPGIITIVDISLTVWGGRGVASDHSRRCYCWGAGVSRRHTIGSVVIMGCWGAAAAAAGWQFRHLGSHQSIRDLWPEQTQWH